MGWTGGRRTSRGIIFSEISLLLRDHELTIRHKTLRLTVQLQLMDSLKPANGSAMVNHPRLAFPPQSGEPATLHSLLPVNMRERAGLIFALPYHNPQHMELSSIPGGQRFFPPLSPDVPVIDALRGTSFVEFPTIRVYAKAEWDDKQRRGEVVVLPLLQPAAPISDSPKKFKDQTTLPDASTNNAVGQGASPLVHTPPIYHAVETKTPTTMAPAPTLGLGLGNYDSDEEDEDAVEEAA